MSTDSNQPTNGPNLAKSSSSDLSNRIYTFLRSIPSFSRLSKEELINLSNACHLETYTKGEHILNEGDQDNSDGFIVLTGRLAMIKSSQSGRDLVVELLPAGDMFGLLLALSPTYLPCDLSARAQLKSVLVWMPVKAIKPILQEHPGIYADFFRILLEHLHASFRVSEGLAHDRVEVRIATILLRLAATLSRIPQASHDQTIDITRYQIAELTGTTTESAIRTTRSMEKSGLIDIRKPGIIVIRNLLGLRLIADQI